MGHTVRRADAEYVAGILDGAGSFSLRPIHNQGARRRWSWRAMVRVTAAAPAALAKLAAATGRPASVRGGAAVWSVSDAGGVLEVLRAAMPQMAAKRPHARRLAAACEAIVSLPPRTAAGYAQAFAEIQPGLMRLSAELSALNRRRR